MKDALLIFWDELTATQKLCVIAVFVLLAVAAVSGWASSMSAWSEVRRYEREAIRHKADAEEALKRAAAVATEIRRKEVELGKLEDAADEKNQQVLRAGGDRIGARAEYERIRREPRTDVPSSEQLCGELAELGYPCR